MKGSYKMYCSARNLARFLILLFIVFQVMTVIVTLERYRELESPIDLFTRKAEDATTTSGGRHLNSSPDEAGRSSELPLDSTPGTTTTETQVHAKGGNLLESFPDVLRNLMLQKLALVSKPKESAAEERSDATASDATTSNTTTSDATTSNTTSDATTSEWNLIQNIIPDVHPLLHYFISSDVTTSERNPIQNIKSEDENDDHPLPHYSTSNTESSVTDMTQFITTEESDRFSADEMSRHTVALEMSPSPETPSPPPKATTPTAKPAKRKRFSLMNTFLSLIQSVAKRVQLKPLQEEPETTTQPFTFKGLLAFSSEYDTEGVIRSAGYPVETYKVTTQDGYVLTVHRIPPRSPPRRPAQANYLPVFLQHGLWSSSYHWFEDKPQYTLPFLLSDKGFDVWMGNCRGNVISQEHVSLPIDTNSSFWDFSFHEMGVYDLPAVIEHVLAVTKKPQLHYIGHSMGTTMFFVMASLRPDVAEKVHFMLALAPIATVGPIRSFFRWLVLMEKFILMREKPIAYLAQVGISLKTILHYMQLYVTGKFEMYNYGKIANMDIYKSPVPPSYNLGNVSVPTVLCYGTKDTFLTYDDIETLQSSLGNSLGIWPLPLNHFQFPNGKVTKEILYNYIPLHLH